jgi:uncharacterized protein (UPF0276 family)
MNAFLSDQMVSDYRPIPVDVGIALCPEHHGLVLGQRPQVAWFEVQAETLLRRGDWLREVTSVARDYPLSLQAAGLSLGSVTRPEAADLRQLGELITRLQPDFVSDQLPWSAVESIHAQEVLARVVRNITHVQDTLKRQILLEHPPKTLCLPDTALSEESFLAEVVLRTGCGVVLDVNNLHASATHLGADAHTLLANFFEAIEPESIAEIHLAGRSVVTDGSCSSLSIEGHGSHVCAPVWKLFERAVATIGPVPTLVEWDRQTPAFDVLQAEAATARSILLQGTRQAELAFPNVAGHRVAGT